MLRPDVLFVYDCRCVLLHPCLSAETYERTPKFLHELPQNINYIILFPQQVFSQFSCLSKYGVPAVSVSFHGHFLTDTAYLTFRRRVSLVLLSFFIDRPPA